MEYLAKSNGITLKKHSIDVMEMSEILLKKSGINDEKLINITKIAALLHDIGKTAPFFQENINNNEELSKYPRHNEIGFALLKCLIDDNYGFYEDKKWVELIQYSTLYHHTPHNNENWFSDYFDNNNLNNISNYYNQLFTECEFSKIIRFKNNVDINEECIYIGTTKTFSFIKPDEGVKTSNLEKLKYFEIIFNIVRYADLIVSGKYEYNQFRANPNIIYDNALMPTHFDKERWDEQCDVANQAYGNNMTISGDITIGTINPFRYKGYYYDSETQLFYCNSRYYSPELCRWISPDSIEYLDPESINGLNLYSYCNNDPVNYFDPDGHSALLIIGLIIGAAIGFGATAYVDYQDDGEIFNGSVKWYDYLGATVLGGAIGAGLGAFAGMSFSATLPTGFAMVQTSAGTMAIVATGSTTLTLTGAQVLGVAGVLGATYMFYKEHTKNARESTKNKHQKGQARKGKDMFRGEKGDARRPYRRNKKRGFILPFLPFDNDYYK
jgi:CRISPR-associated endonuclease Cas3-HD